MTLCVEVRGQLWGVGYDLSPFEVVSSAGPSLHSRLAGLRAGWFSCLHDHLSIVVLGLKMYTLLHPDFMCSRGQTWVARLA